MIRKPSRSALAAISLLCIVLLTACSSGGPVLRSITVSPTSANVDAAVIGSGNTQQFTAKGLYSNGETKDVTTLATWASSNSGVASVDATGLATASNPPDTTTVTITASLGGQANTATLTVIHDVTSIAVAPLAKSGALGLEAQFTATATYLNVAGGSHTEDVSSIASWNSSNPLTATINNTGKASTLGLATGTTNITASITKTGSSTVITSTPVAVLTVTAPVVTSLQVSPSGPTIAVGTSTNLTALELDTNQKTHTPSGTVTWATSACTPAGAVLIAASGVNGNEAVSGQAAGSCKVTATEGALTGNTTVTVVTGTTHFAVVANNGDSTIGGYAVNASAATPLTPLSPATTAVNTTQQAVVNPNGKYLYSIGSNGDVHVYKLDSSTNTMALQTPEPNPLPSVGTSTFNYGIVDPTGRFFLAIDLDGNAVHSAKISPTDGSLGTVSSVTGLGSGPGVGPEFVATDRQGKFAYVVSDNDTLYAFAINQTTGVLTPLSTPSYSTGAGSDPFAVTVDPSNKFVYTANFGNNTVSVFTLDSTTGLLTPGTTFTVTGGITVENVIVDPSSKYLFVLDGGNGGATTPVPGAVYGFNINATTGAVGTALTGSPVSTELDPEGIAIDATGTLIATENATSNSISLIKVGTGGAMSAESPATVATGNLPLWVTFLNAP